MDYNKELFAQKLTEFFDRQDPLKKIIVSEIVNKFHDEQDKVFKHLSAIYAKKNEVEDVTISEITIFAVPGASHSGHLG